MKRCNCIQETDEKIANSDRSISESLEVSTEKPFNAIRPHRKLSRICVQELLAGLLSSHEAGCLGIPVRLTTDVSGPSGAPQSTGSVLRRVATREGVAEILFASKPQRAELQVATRLRRNYTSTQRRVGGMVTQRIANPCTPVRFRYSPPFIFNGLDRGRKKTTIPDPARPCPQDKVNRNFNADAPTSSGSPTSPMCKPRWERLRAAFVIDVFPRKIVGWRV